MSIASAREFYERIQDDGSLRKKLEAAPKNQRQSILKAEGYDFTKAEMKEVVAESVELTTADLERVTGGSTSGWVSAGATTAGAVAAAF